jgi:acyl-CoA synthetase (AMP-forming)/AMP-acid ligase II
MAPAITLPAVPALWRAWYDAAAIPKNTRLAISAGAPLPLALEEEIFRSARIKVHNFYGATECGGIAYDATEAPRTNAAYAGAFVKNVELSLSDDGCLRVRGRAVGETYLPEPSATLAKGCYQTSDLAEMIDGQVFLYGRASDQINVAGRKVSPESIERVLLAHPQISDCLVFGAPSLDSGRTEFIVASIARRAQVTAEDLKQFLLERIPAWQIPRDWIFVKAFETNQRGKLSRAEWRKKYLAERT